MGEILAINISDDSTEHNKNIKAITPSIYKKNNPYCAVTTTPAATTKPNQQNCRDAVVAAAAAVVAAASEFAATATCVMNSTTSVDVKSATNFHSCRPSHHHYHYRTHHQLASVSSRSNENKMVAANNRTMDSLNYWKRAFGSPEQTLMLSEKIIKVGNGIQQLNAANNNLPINNCFPVIKDRKSTTTSKCKCIIRPTSKSNLKTLSPIQNSPQFLESPLAQLARQYDNETDVKLSKFIYQFASTKNTKQKSLIQTKYPVEKKKINIYNNDGIENINSIYNNEINYSNNLRHLEKKRKVESLINKVNNLPSQNSTVTNEIIKQEINNINYLKHENLIMPLRTDAQLSSSTSSSSLFLSKLVIYNTTNYDDAFNNNCQLNNNNNNNNNNNLFNNDFDYNSDIISGSTVIESADTSTTGRYDDEDGTLVFAIEI